MAAVRVLGEDGQIAFGERYAGRRALVDELEPGVWIMKLGEPIPDSERWLHEPEVKAKLDRAIARAEKESLRETDLEELERRLLGSE